MGYSLNQMLLVLDSHQVSNYKHRVQTHGTNPRTHNPTIHGRHPRERHPRDIHSTTEPVEEDYSKHQRDTHAIPEDTHPTSQGPDSAPVSVPAPFQISPSPLISPKNLAIRIILAYTFPIGTQGRRKLHDPTPFTNRPARTHPPPPLRRPLRAPRLALRRGRLHRQNFDHRKSWLLARMKTLGEVFAIRIAAYAVMGNHYHVVLMPFRAGGKPRQTALAEAVGGKARNRVAVRAEGLHRAGGLDRAAGAAGQKGNDCAGGVVGAGSGRGAVAGVDAGDSEAGDCAVPWTGPGEGLGEASFEESGVGAKLSKIHARMGGMAPARDSGRPGGSNATKPATGVKSLNQRCRCRDLPI